MVCIIFQNSSPLYAGRTGHIHTLPKFMHRLTIVPRSLRSLLVIHRKRCPDRYFFGVVLRRGYETRLRRELREVVSCIGRTSFRAGRRLSPGFSHITLLPLLRPSTSLETLGSLEKPL